MPDTDYNLQDVLKISRVSFQASFSAMHYSFPYHIEIRIFYYVNGCIIYSLLQFLNIINWKSVY